MTRNVSCWVFISSSELFLGWWPCAGSEHASGTIWELTLISISVLSCFWESSRVSPSWSECPKKLQMDVLGSWWPSTRRSCRYCRHSATALSGASTLRQTHSLSIHTNTAVLYICARGVQIQPDSELKLLPYSMTPVNGNLRCLLTRFSLPHNGSASKFIQKQGFKWKGSVVRHEVSKIRADILAAYIFMLGSALWAHQSSNKQISKLKTKDVRGNILCITIVKRKYKANILDLERMRSCLSQEESKVPRNVEWRKAVYVVKI